MTDLKRASDKADAEFRAAADAYRSALACSGDITATRAVALDAGERAASTRKAYREAAESSNARSFISIS